MCFSKCWSLTLSILQWEGIIDLSLNLASMTWMGMGWGKGNSIKYHFTNYKLISIFTTLKRFAWKRTLYIFSHFKSNSTLDSASRLHASSFFILLSTQFLVWEIPCRLIYFLFSRLKHGEKKVSAAFKAAMTPWTKPVLLKWVTANVTHFKIPCWNLMEMISLQLVISHFYTINVQQTNSFPVIHEVSWIITRIIQYIYN